MVKSLTWHTLARLKFSQSVFTFYTNWMAKMQQILLRAGKSTSCSFWEKGHLTGIWMEIFLYQTWNLSVFKLIVWKKYFTPELPYPYSACNLHHNFNRQQKASVFAEFQGHLAFINVSFPFFAWIYIFLIELFKIINAETRELIKNRNYITIVSIKNERIVPLQPAY